MHSGSTDRTWSTPAAAGVLSHPKAVPRVVLVAPVLAAVFFAARVPFLARTLDGVDSANFALAIHDFNVGQHQPHAPGFPVFVALGKLSYWLLSMLIPGADGVTYEARALAVWGVVFGALSVFPLLQLFRAIELNERRAIVATTLTLACPLFLFTAGRPMSDVPGLAIALTAQAFIVSALRATPRTAGTCLTVGASIAGLAIGFRVQTACLTLPLLALVVWRIRGGAPHLWRRAVGAAVIGVLLWGVPLLVASGGPGSYLESLVHQAQDDAQTVDLLANHVSPRRVVSAVTRSIVRPWAAVPLATVILLLACAGMIAMLLRARDGFMVVAAAAVPYGLFHLFFQDTVFVRYALPLVPPIAYLAARGIDVVGRRATPAVLAGVVVTSGTITLPPIVRYAANGSPLARALEDVRGAAPATPEAPVVAMHHAAAQASRGESIALRILPAPPKREWLEVVRYWRAGGEAPVWFLANAKRSDLALIDPAARRLVRAYRWGFSSAAFMSGMRPDNVDWYELRDPGWFVGEGWALTPETGGVARESGLGPDRRPIVAWVRRRPEGAILMLGGRNYGGPCELAARIVVRIDGRVAAAIVARPNRPFFEVIHLAPGSLAASGPFARLEIASEPVDGSGREAAVTIQQFDVQSVNRRVVHGYDVDWHDPEYDVDTGRLWRWTGPASTLRIVAERDVTLRVRGETPTRRAPVNIAVDIGAERVASVAASGLFALDVRVPRALLDRAQGAVTLRANHTFVPAEIGQSPDRRRLGLRVDEVRVF
jgi:hypothetical protein